MSDCKSLTPILYCPLITFLAAPILAEKMNPVPRRCDSPIKFAGDFPKEWINYFADEIMIMCNQSTKPEYNCYLQAEADEYLKRIGKGFGIQYNMKTLVTKKWSPREGQQIAKKAINHWGKGICNVSFGGMENMKSRAF
ncbi:unnamed protein product [Cylicocyclus nassatus]|uniref:Uncharacterized protein n=1 Tax=Cylicocyclus nassatus TaxID=53992 RepID=A0AA36DSZ7_CYLNA|nr:unnamed protein product [Cylicocyclus nassatus]